MKKVIFGLLATVLFMPDSFAQSNNPYNQVGIDIVNAAEVILKDYQEGKIKDLNQTTLDYYYKTALSNYPKIRMGDFTKVMDALKNATNESIIKNSGYSDEGTKFLNKMLTNYSITALVDEVKKSSVPDIEKQNILYMLAINYSLVQPVKVDKTVNKTTAKGPNADFSVIDYDSISLANAEGEQAVIWGALGFITGNAICGLPCGFAGAILGLIIGSSNGSTTIRPTGGSGFHPKP